MNLSRHIIQIKRFTHMTLLGSHNNPMRKILLLLASFYKEAVPQIIWETGDWWNGDLKQRILALKPMFLATSFILPDW